MLYLLVQLYGWRQTKIYLNLHPHHLNKPTKHKFHTVTKTDLKKAHTMLKLHKLWNLDFGENECPNLTL